jgi:hypothetical protein
VDPLESRVLLTGAPLSAVPQLNSYPAGTCTIYLDFVGAPAQSWNGYIVPQTPAFDLDGDPTTFSPAELTAVQQTWACVAEKYSPFNVNVTTVPPASLEHNSNMEIIIGGNSNWTGGTTGGISTQGSYSNIFLTNESFIFPANLANDPAIMGTAAAHEAGHEIGLSHQSLYDASGNLLSPYNTGNSLIAPIMGIAYNSQRGLWWNGPSQEGSTIIQDDLAVISGSNNVGYRPQDHGQSIATANPLSVAGMSVSGSGVIASVSDSDTFRFTTGTGPVSLSVNVPIYTPMLHAKAVLMDGAGHVLVTSADPNSLGQTISTTLPSGTYYLAVQSFGQYGDLGQYTVTGTVAPKALAFTLEQATDHQHISWTAGSSSGQVSIADPNGLTLTGDSSNDPITLDYTNGNPLPNILHLRGAFTFSALQGASPFASTTLEIGQSTVYFSYNPGSTPLAAVQAALAAAYNGGAWTGDSSAGIITSTALQSGSSNFALGFADSADGIVPGQPLNTVEVRYTVAADANLDGTVDATDALLMSRNWLAASSPTWDLGNFNYDSQVNLTDAGILQKTWGQMVTVVVPSTAPGASTALASPVSSANMVAEQPRRKPDHRRDRQRL